MACLWWGEGAGACCGLGWGMVEHLRGVTGSGTRGPVSPLGPRRQEYESGKQAREGPPARRVPLTRAVSLGACTEGWGR